MAETGSLALYMALALAVYATVASVLGKARGAYLLLESARRAVYLVPAALGVATISLVLAFLTHDFQVEYVAAHSNRAMNPVYTWVAFYAGNEGSLLYIALVLSGLAALAVKLGQGSVRESLPITCAILMGTLSFFLIVLVTLASPFALLPLVPPDGQGINPLLTHPGMFLHPPLLMAGLIGMTVPFSLAMGALLVGHGTDHWAEATRVWGLVVWTILGIGLLLGAWWAYTILGWGGYWGWDPIENVALMPWLALTAFLHSIMVQRRRGMFRTWNMVLISIAFTLALFGVFINRGGPVPSVHSFASSTLGWVFLAFLGVGLAFSLGALFLRHGALKSTATLDSPISREAAFLVNNLLLLGIAFVTLWGVMYPLLSQATRGVTVTVGAPFYNQVNGPLLLLLVFLMGIGPLLPWRHATLGSLKRALLAPGVAALGVVVLLAALGVRNPFPLASFGLCALVAASVLQEWTRGTLVRHHRGESYALAFARLIAANRPRYGGYIAHLAIVFLALGVTGSSFYGVQRDVILAPGEKVAVQEYTVEYLSPRTLSKPDRLEFFNDVRVSKNGEYLPLMTAWRAYYPSFRMSSTRAAIRSTPLEDLYIVSSESLEDGRVGFRILVNPLVWWMWLAGPLLLLGALVALWPQRRASLAVIRAPHAAVSVAEGD